jgi:hypothetical protein
MSNVDMASVVKRAKWISAFSVDMAMPQMNGSYATHVNRAQALKLIATLSSPSSRYRSEPQLKFVKWE